MGNFTSGIKVDAKVPKSPQKSTLGKTSNILPAPSLPTVVQVRRPVNDVGNAQFSGVFAVKSKPTPEPYVPLPPPVCDQIFTNGVSNAHYSHESKHTPGQFQAPAFPSHVGELTSFHHHDASSWSWTSSLPSHAEADDATEEHCVLNWQRNHSNGTPTHLASTWMNDLLGKAKYDDWGQNELIEVTAVPEEDPVIPETVKEEEDLVDEKPRAPFYGIYRLINPIRQNDIDVKCSYCQKTMKKQSFRTHVFLVHKKVGSYR
jgi:hypothetical protein